MTLKPGQILDDKYQILSPLGQGGMAAVFKAKQLHLNRTVAIKTLLSTDSSGDMQLRFDRESAILSLMIHPNLIRVYGQGIAGSAHYLVQQYIEGASLDTLLASKSITHVDAIRRMAEVCDGLAYAHSRKVFHRDIKPSNVMVCRGADQKQSAVLIDFGLACIVEQAIGSNFQKLTQDGIALGTAPYMSPEQCVGAEVDHRTDIYSVGCVLHEIATGEPPFGDADVYVTMERHVNEDYTKTAGADIDTRLRDIIVKCLQKDPNHRYQTATELAEDIRDYLSDPRAVLSPAELAPQTMKGLRGTKGSISLTRLVITAAVAVTAAGGWIFMTQTPSQVRTKQTNTTSATSLRVDALDNLAAGYRAFRDEDFTRAREAHKKAVSLARQCNDRNLLLESNIALADSLLRYGSPRAARALIFSQLPSIRPQPINELYRKALEVVRGSYGEEQDYVRQMTWAIKVDEYLKEQISSLKSGSQYEIGLILLRQGKYRAALKCFETSNSIETTLYQTNPWTYEGMGIALANLGEYAKAQHNLSNAHTEFLKSPRSSITNCAARTTVEIAYCKLILKDYDGALGVLSELSKNPRYEKPWPQKSDVMKTREMVEQYSRARKPPPPLGVAYWRTDNPSERLKDPR